MGLPNLDLGNGFQQSKVTAISPEITRSIEDSEIQNVVAAVVSNSNNDLNTSDNLLNRSGDTSRSWIFIEPDNTPQITDADTPSTSDSISSVVSEEKAPKGTLEHTCIEDQETDLEPPFVSVDIESGTETAESLEEGQVEAVGERKLGIKDPQKEESWSNRAISTIFTLGNRFYSERLRLIYLKYFTSSYNLIFNRRTITVVLISVAAVYVIQKLINKNN